MEIVYVTPPTSQLVHYEVSYRKPYGRRFFVKYLLSILTLFAVPLTSGAVNAEEKEDREAIRALFHQEQQGHRLGNEKMVRSAHWDDFYLVRTPRKNEVPRYMLSGIYLGKDYLGNFDYKP